MARVRPSTPCLSAQLDILFSRGLVTCGICGKPILARGDCQWDHTHAHGLGGENAVRNLRPVHVECHKPKTRGDILNIAKARPARAEKLLAHKIPLDADLVSTPSGRCRKCGQEPCQCQVREKRSAFGGGR